MLVRSPAKLLGWSVGLAIIALFLFAVATPLWDRIVNTTADGRPLSQPYPPCPRCKSINTAIFPIAEKGEHGFERFCLDCKWEFTP